VSVPWLAHDEAPGPYITIPQYQFNKTKQHTHPYCGNRSKAPEYVRYFCGDSTDTPKPFSKAVKLEFPKSFVII